ncbi:uncharacterized protein [Nicotiana tomentosiformis]|uniref:uncharacterized protein n=1 Tax=Nicotiana tomentosiformis TaxID=4098 RepID=UPI00388C5B90
MRPPSADDDIHIDPLASKQVKEKQKRKALSPSDPKTKKWRKQSAHKPKKDRARELSSNSLNRLRDKSEEEADSELVARVRSNSKMPRAMEVVEETVVEVSDRLGTDLARTSEVEKENVVGTSRSEDNAPKEALGIIDLSGPSSFTNSMINKAQALRGNLGEGAQGLADSFHNCFDGMDSAASEDVASLGDLSSSVLHHEAFLRFREEFKRHEAETRELTENKDTYKLLSEKLQAKLEAARKEQADLLEHSQKRLDQVGKLQVEVDAVKADAEEWKKNMNRLASEKETTRAQLASTEVQLQAAKEKNSAQAKTIKELQSQLSLVVSGQENLAKELEAAKLEIITARNEADKGVA